MEEFVQEFSVSKQTVSAPIVLYEWRPQTVA